MPKNTFKAGQSGNPNGRPKGSKNKVKENQQFKDHLKSHSKDALDVIVEMMSISKLRAQDLKWQIDDLDEQIVQLEEQSDFGDEDEDLKGRIRELRRERSSLLKQLDESIKDTGAYAVRITDYMFKLVTHEDRIDISKFKAKMEESDTGDDEEDDETPKKPLVSLKAVERR